MDAGGTITRIATVNYPENGLRDGLELLLDPTFLVTEDGEIQYANRTAPLAFGIRRSPGRCGSFDEKTGLAFQPDATPLDMVNRRAMVETQIDSDLDVIAGRHVMVMTGVSFRAAAYYVVMLRAIDG